MQLAVAALLALLPASSVALAAPKAVNQKIDSGANVVLLTLDGVRWEEVFHGADPGQTVDPNPEVFSFLTGALTTQGVLFGDRTRGDVVRVGNSHFNSLPGYQAIMAGAA